MCIRPGYMGEAIFLHLHLKINPSDETFANGLPKFTRDTQLCC